MKFLIVGQGLAGTLVGFRLERAGHVVQYQDAPGQTAASEVAAGIINPITGRRFVKSWKIDELIPEAIDVYTQLGKLLGANYWHPQSLIRTLYNRGDLNDWQVRSADEGYQRYLEDEPDIGRISDLTQPVFAYAGVRHAGRVSVGQLVRDYRGKLMTENRFEGKAFDYSRVSDSLQAADRIIFCEGWRGRFNPYFDFAGHSGNKGEVLFVRTKAPQLDRMFKHRVFLVPVAGDLYWVGATSENRFADESVTAANRSFLEDRLAEVLKVPYEIVRQQAAVRPTTKDRRMLVGAHPENKQLFILNGLGTKGASLGPTGSKWLVELMLEGKPVPGEVNVNRFFKGSAA